MQFDDAFVIYNRLQCVISLIFLTVSLGHLAPFRKDSIPSECWIFYRKKRPRTHCRIFVQRRTFSPQKKKKMSTIREESCTCNSESCEVAPCKSYSRCGVKAPSCVLDLNLGYCSACSKKIGSCSNCQKVTSLLFCSRCKIARYCSKQCQVSAWTNHREACNAIVQQREQSAREPSEISKSTPSIFAPSALVTEEEKEKLNPSITKQEQLTRIFAEPYRSEQNIQNFLLELTCKRLTLSGNTPFMTNPKAKDYVSDGKTKVSKVTLRTWGVNTCVLLVLFGQGEVIMTHLSGWNAPGNPFQNECRDLHKILPRNFKFSKGFLVPGQNITRTLCPNYNPTENVLQDLLWEMVGDFEWKNKLVMLLGLKANYTVLATAKTASLKFYVNPYVPELPDGEMCVVA